MSAIENVNNVCSFTGHRILSKNFNEQELKTVIVGLIKEGVNTFLVGMALGFDSKCFQTLYYLKREYDIRIIAVVPCADQSRYFNKSQKEEYQKMLSQADETVVLSNGYYDGCMMVRNHYLVDNSSVVVAYINYNRGGTYQTVKYAAEKQRRIIYVGKS